MKDLPEGVQFQTVVAVAGVVHKDGKVYTEEALRNAGDGRNGGWYRYDEASQSLVYHGPALNGFVYHIPDKP